MVDGCERNAATRLRQDLQTVQRISDAGFAVTVRDRLNRNQATTSGLQHESYDAGAVAAEMFAAAVAEADVIDVMNIRDVLILLSTVDVVGGTALDDARAIDLKLIG